MNAQLTLVYNLAIYSGQKLISKFPEFTYKQRNVDALAQIVEGAGAYEPKNFHYECQTHGGDREIALRIIEYAAGYAFQDVYETPGHTEPFRSNAWYSPSTAHENADAAIRIPHSAVILLRGSKKRKNHLHGKTIERNGSWSGKRRR